MKFSVMKRTDERIIAAFIMNFLTYFGPVFLMSFASSYMTDVLNYGAYQVAAALLLGRIFDAVVSALSGPIVQRINPSRGRKDKLASWADLTGVLSFISLLLMFTDTSFLGKGGIWVSCLWYALFSGTNDIMTGVIYSMLGIMSGSDQDIRNRISISMSRSAKITGIFSGLCTLPLLNFFGRICPGKQYTIVGGILGFAIMLGMYIYRRVYEKYVDYKPEKEKREQSEAQGILILYKSLIKNDALRAIVIADLFYYSGAYIFANLGVYYFKLMGEFDATYSLINGLVSGAGVVGAFLMPMIGLRLGKKKSKTIWFFTYSLLTICLGFLGARSVWIYFVVMGLGQLLFNLWFFYQASYLLDASEYYLYKTGIDTRIAAPATVQVANDIGGAIGGALAGYGIALIGYDNIDIMTLSNVTPDFMQKFMLLFSLGGLLLLVGAFCWKKLYKITDEEAVFYAKENAKRYMVEK